LDDVVSAIAEALAAFAVWVDSASPLAWPLVLALVFPTLVAAFRLWIWFMRGTAWPTSCAYGTTRKGFCKRPVPGEWYKCWQHRRRWIRRTDGHAVDPGLDRWEVRDRHGRPLQGVSFLRNRHGTDTILFHRHGFARSPVAVVRYLTGDWRDVWRRRTHTLVSNLRALRLRTVVSEYDFEKTAVSPRAYVAADVMRAILPTVGAGLCFTAMSVPLDESGRQVAQYMASACFMAAWSFVRYGLWQGLREWRATAHRQTLLWFGGFMLAALIVGTATSA
jgi:hypothetical protein